MAYSECYTLTFPPGPLWNSGHWLQFNVQQQRPPETKREVALDPGDLRKDFAALSPTRAGAQPSSVHPGASQLSCIVQLKPHQHFADDMNVAALIGNSDESAHRLEVKLLAEWCECQKLSLNVKRVKGRIIDFRKAHVLSCPFLTAHQ